MLKPVQIGLNTADMAGSVRLYTELFGFVNAGGKFIWGPGMRIQGLDPTTARAILWWLVGSQPFFQLELFHHTSPSQRPLPADWVPADHGWTRFGAAVSRFDEAEAVLDRWAIRPIGWNKLPRGGRKLAFRDPFVGCVVELIEADDLLSPAESLSGKIIYATSSVADLDAARQFYQVQLELPIRPLSDLHRQEDEALWGLADSQRRGFVVATEPLLEIVQYDFPLGRPRPADYRTADQGMVNIALGTRVPGELDAAITRVERAGCTLSPIQRHGGAFAAYSLDPGREVELLMLPEALDADFGFEPAKPFWVV